MLEFCGIEIKEDKVEEIKNILEIKRFERESDQANRSVQLLNGSFFGFGLECPNLNNTPFKSRIDTGEYIARKVYTPKRGWFWLLDDANGRTEIILNHPGSTLINISTGKQNFKGCIGLGAEIDNMPGQRAISETEWMCKQFMEATKGFDIMRVVIT